MNCWEVRGQRSEVGATVTSHNTFLTWGLVESSDCRGASAQDELHEVMLVFPFRLLSLKQRRLQEVPSHSVVLLQPHLLPVCRSRGRVSLYRRDLTVMFLFMNKMDLIRGSCEVVSASGLHVTSRGPSSCTEECVGMFPLRLGLKGGGGEDRNTLPLSPRSPRAPAGSSQISEKRRSEVVVEQMFLLMTLLLLHTDIWSSSL